MPLIFRVILLKIFFSKTYEIIYLLKTSASWLGLICCTLCCRADQVAQDAQPGHQAVNFDPKELHIQLEQQLIGQTDRPAARRRLFSG